MINTELFIAKRLALGDKNSFSRFIIRIAVVAIALSVTVMIVSTCMVSGFSKEIKERIFGFWGQVHITNFANNESLETMPIKKEQVLVDKIRNAKDVKNIAPFITKAGILKTKTDIEGIALKGINKEYDWKTIQSYIKQGNIIAYNDSSASKDILISQSTAKRLHLQVGDKVIAYFIRKELAAPIGRKLQVCGIFHTGLEEYDKQYALVDMELLRTLNQWQANEVAGYEIRLHDMNKMDAFKDSVYYKYVDQSVNAQTMKDINRNIFEWLDLQKVNEYLIVGFMVIVAMLNMITALIILILDRTNMIGILKALGANSKSITNIFLYNASYIILNGLFWGNLFGIGLCLLQRFTGFIKLNEENYYLSVAPVDFNIIAILLINAGTLVICTLVLLLPTQLINKISPIKAIRFE
ncbi:MAG: ABC transporter permease [Chitinophagales bacterium]|nr:ABC transporter permease [Chitinophagales bacterium]HMW12540.1 ABC transporter permease [Chitinophagales bacterium]HMX60109.1 ABC transporter permease [Chitinophagales bacterium]HMY23798.1 ABC transporter permease [Chitinophagales bacterium]HMZ33707.1 ABC transporter permease [Chitinophagales bacterium]